MAWSFYLDWRHILSTWTGVMVCLPGLTTHSLYLNRWHGLPTWTDVTFSHVSWSSRPPERSRRAIACRKVVVLLSAAPIPPPSGKQGEKLAVTWEDLTNGKFRGWMNEQVHIYVSMYKTTKVQWQNASDGNAPGSINTKNCKYAKNMKKIVCHLYTGRHKSSRYFKGTQEW